MTEPATDDTTADTERFQLTWPKRLSEQVRSAARRTRTPVGAWLRQAAEEKLERDHPAAQLREQRSA